MLNEPPKASPGQPQDPGEPDSRETRWSAAEAEAGAPAGLKDAMVMQLAEEVGQLAEKHRQELNSCLEHWVQHLRERAPNLSRPASGGLPELPASGGPAELVVSGPRVADASPSAQARTSLVRTSLVRPGAPHGGANFSADDTKRVSSKKSTATARGRRRRKLELLAAMESPDEVSMTRMQRITQSRYYEWASGILICLNATFIGWQTQYMALHAMEAAEKNIPLEQDMPAMFVVLQGTFTLLFMVELAPRWVCEGFIGFFQDADRWWNLLDVIVVAFSTLDLVLHLCLQRRELLGDLSVLRVLRVVRVVRVAKVIRIMKFFRELRLMVFSILRSMKSLVWVVLVLAILFFLFGVSFTAATIITLDSMEQWRSEDTERLREFFGTVDRSILSLFMAMSGGNNWWVFYSALSPLPHMYSYFFLVYVAFSLFAVVNIVTGVFVESALQSNNDDKIVTANEELEAKKDYLRAMREIFEEMDDDNTGVVSLDQFEQKLADERVIAYFHAMKLDVSEARKLFWLIDYDQSNEVDIDEFVSGCYKLQGESRNLDIKLMECEVYYLHECFMQFSQTVANMHGIVTDLHSRLYQRL